MQDRLDLWCGDFGDEYHARNQFSDADLEHRKRFWQKIIQKVELHGAWHKSPFQIVMEMGAGMGINLKAIKSIRPELYFYAIEPNIKAVDYLNTLWPVVAHTACRDQFKADLVFTFGVLIHIPSPGLLPMMRDIYCASNRYILCAEYFSPEERVVPYQGKMQALWTRPYGDLWLDHFPDLKLLAYGFEWRRQTGLDNITWWLMEKPDGPQAKTAPEAHVGSQAAREAEGEVA